MTCRQFYIMLFITTVSLKVQKLPAIIYDAIGKDGYLILLAYFAVDLLLIALAFYILNRKHQLMQVSQKPTLFAEILKRTIAGIIVFYFLAQGLLLFESIQNLFEHILFDNLSWFIFGFLLLFTIFYVAYSGIKNIARSFELYFWVITISYLIISIFGATKADFSAVLPFETINPKKILSFFVDFNLWFGDFFLILFMGNRAKDIKFKWTALVYTISIAFVMLLFVELNGIYGDYTSMKPALITTITEQSMLGVNIGRVDWFLILFTEIGTILTCGLCLYFAKQCFKFIVPKASDTILLFGLILLLYVLDVFYLVDMHTRIRVFTGYMSYVSAATKWGSFMLMFLFCLCSKNKGKKQQNSPTTNAFEECCVKNNTTLKTVKNELKNNQTNQQKSRESVSDIQKGGLEHEEKV